MLINDPVARLSVQPAALKQVGALSPQALQAISQVLVTGKILEVVINQERKTGQRGFVLFGQFIPATVPETVRNGERLHVRVSEAEDSLILKIVSDAERSAAGETPQPLEELVSQRSMRGLRAGVSPAPTPLDEDLLKQLESAPETPPQIKLVIKNFFSLLERMGRQKEMIARDTAAGASAALAETLAGIVESTDQKTRKRTSQVRNAEIRSLLQELGSAIKALDSAPQAELESMLAPLKGASAALAKLQRTFEGRDLIEQFNIVMGKLGQSSFALLPAYVDGNFANWELQFDRRELDELKRFSAGEESGAPFFNLHLFLNFSGLGPVRADLALRPGECLVRLTLAQEEAAQFAASHAARFESTLKELGYTTVGLQCRHGEAAQVTPAWLAELARFDTTT